MVLIALVACFGLIAAGVVLWWRNPLLIPGTYRVDVYALEDDISGPPAHTPGLLSRLVGMCDADSYYVKQNGRPYCLVLNADTSTDDSTALAHVRVTTDDGNVVIKPADVEMLRDTATRVPQLTGGPSQTLVLVVRGTPIAVVPVDTLAVSGEIRVPTFD